MESRIYSRIPALAIPEQRLFPERCESIETLSLRRQEFLGTSAAPMIAMAIKIALIRSAHAR